MEDLSIIKVAEKSLSEEIANKKRVTIKKLALSIIEENGWPKDYVRLIPDSLGSAIIYSKKSYDLDDELDEVRLTIKTAQSLIIEVMKKDLTLDAVQKEQQKILDFLAVLSRQAYYFKD